MEDGLSSDEAAEIFLKQAEILNACSDCIVREKRALGLPSLKSTMTGAGLALGIPAAIGYGSGRFLGDAAANTLTPVNELTHPSYQKVEEILRMKRETADILARVEAKKKLEAARKNERSVRTLF